MTLLWIGEGFPFGSGSDSALGWIGVSEAMTRPLSMDLRERAMARLAAGESVRGVAAALSVSPSSVVKWSKRLRETGSVTPGRIGG